MQLLMTCSTFSKIRRTLVYVHLFVKKTRKRNSNIGPITVKELKESETQLFWWTQLHLEPSAIAKKLIPKPHENGLLRAQRRLEDVKALPEKLWNSVILPSDNLLFKLLLLHLHHKRGHCGYKRLISDDKRKYWIIRVGNVSKALTAKCFTCKKLRKGH